VCDIVKSKLVVMIFGTQQERRLKGYPQ